MLRWGFVRKATRHDGVQAAARVGYAVSGILHLLIGYIIVRIAFGGGGNADPSGALATVATGGGGVAALWLIAVSLIPLTLWRLAEAIIGLHPAEGDSDPDDGRVTSRLRAVGLLLVYCGVAFTAVRFANGNRQSSGQQTAGLSAKMMQFGWGQTILVIGGAVTVVIGVYYAYKGASRNFLADMTAPGGRVITALGLVGYLVEGLVLCAAGILVIVAVIDRDPGKAAGIDAAVKAAAATRLGTIMLIVAAAGFGAYGCYSLALTRYARM